jgi:hypothetical protein
VLFLDDKVLILISYHKLGALFYMRQSKLLKYITLICVLIIDWVYELLTLGCRLLLKIGSDDDCVFLKITNKIENVKRGVVGK